MQIEPCVLCQVLVLTEQTTILSEPFLFYKGEEIPLIQGSVFIRQLRNSVTRTIRVRYLSLRFRTSQTQFLSSLPVNMALLPAGNGELPLEKAFGFTIDEVCPIIPSEHGGDTRSKLTSMYFMNE